MIIGGGEEISSGHIETFCLQGYIAPKTLLINKNATQEGKKNQGRASNLKKQSFFETQALEMKWVPSPD
jgi:hypothetical protein